MIKIPGVLLLLLLNSIAISVYAQDSTQLPLLNVGDPAPPLQVSEWIKGTPVQEFEKGHVYVVEFWSTWCPPCLKVMPHLSKTARKYKKNVTVISVNVMEKKRYPRSRAKAIIDSMGRRVKYTVAFDDSNRMETEWINRTWRNGVPSAYIVNGQCRIAWIGYPTEMDSVLKAIINNSWDIEAEAKRRNFNYQIRLIDDSIGNEFNYRFHRTGSYSDFYGEPDSIIFHVNKAVEVNPNLKYSDLISYYYFTALLKTDMKKALAYAREAIHPSNPLGPQYFAIIRGIRYLSKYLNLTPDIFELGGQLMEKYGGKDPGNLMEASEWYWRGGNKQKAMNCLKNARKAMKGARSNGYGAFF